MAPAKINITSLHRSCLITTPPTVADAATDDDDVTADAANTVFCTSSADDGLLIKTLGLIWT